MKTILLVALGVVVAGCAGQPDRLANGCAYPDVPSAPAPEWICGSGDAFSVVSSDDYSGGGIRLSRDRAIEKARPMLEDALRQMVTSSVLEQLEREGRVSDEVAARIAAVSASEVSGDSVKGARMYRQSSSPAGVVYVKVGMPLDAAELEARAAIAVAAAKNPALFAMTGGVQGRLTIKR